MPEKDIAISLLEKLLKVISARFKEMLKAAIDEYNKSGITIELVIRKLIEMAKEINYQQERGKDLGLSQEELHFMVL